MPGEFYVVAGIVVTAVLVAACLAAGGSEIMIDFANAISW